MISKFSLLDWILFAALVLGLLVGIFSWWKRLEQNRKSVEQVAESVQTGGLQAREIWVDVAGAVESPGVYKLAGDGRIKDAIEAAEGLSAKADREYIDKSINLAGKLVDGQKIYVPAKGEGVVASGTQAEVKGAETSTKVNINSASESELQELWGVGQARAVEIIANRPYQRLEELLEKKILPKNVYERNQDKMVLY